MAHIGQALTFSVAFTNDSDTAADPATVKFYLREEVDGTELEWTYDDSPVEGTHYPEDMNPITTDSTGTYELVFVARKPERHTGFWNGTGNSVEQSSQVTAFVRHAGVTLAGD